MKARFMWLLRLNGSMGVRSYKVKRGKGARTITRGGVTEFWVITENGVAKIYDSGDGAGYGQRHRGYTSG